MLHDVDFRAIIQGTIGLPGKPGSQGRDGIPGADVSYIHVI